MLRPTTTGLNVGVRFAHSNLHGLAAQALAVVSVGWASVYLLTQILKMVDNDKPVVHLT